TLSIREWPCGSCGAVHDRDVNAAKNILRQGMDLLSGCGMRSDTKQKRDEALPLGESATPEAQPIGSAVDGEFTFTSRPVFGSWSSCPRSPVGHIPREPIWRCPGCWW